jgi:hypothetical protein
MGSHCQHPVRRISLLAEHKDCAADRGSGKVMPRPLSTAGGIFAWLLEIERSRFGPLL